MANSVEIADRKKKELSRTIIKFFEKYAEESSIENLESLDMAALVTHLYSRLDKMEAAMEKSAYLDPIDVVFKQSGDNIVEILPQGSFLTEYRFDIYDPNISDVYRQYRIRHLDDIVRQTVNAVRRAIERALRQKKSKQQVMDIFKRVLGLNEQQEQAVANYEQALQNNSSLALALQNRDKEKDSMVENAILIGVPLTMVQINRLVNQYIANSKLYRSNLIAETELLGAASLGEYEAIVQAGMLGAVETANLRKYWMTQEDERVRANHVAIPVMNPEGVGFFDVFRTPLGAMRYPRDELGVPQNVINCRCFLVYK